MTKRINEIQKYYIDNNLGLSDAELAKTTGCTLSQIHNRRLKVQGKNREGNLKGSPEQTKFPLPPEQVNREAELVNQSQKAVAAQKTAPTGVSGPPVRGIQVNALFARPDKDHAHYGGIVAMTSAASEAGDMLDGVAPKDDKGTKAEPLIKPYDPFSDQTRVHRIKP
jgi:hypothetical protein